MARPAFDSVLQVTPGCLMFFVDETGHEEFADPAYPIFGIGGCAVFAETIERDLKQPWRALKAEFFDGPDVPLHASELRSPSRRQLHALDRFFRNQPFGRFAVTIAKSALLPDRLILHSLLSGSLRKRWEELISRLPIAPAEIAFIHESSERSDGLIERYFSDTKVQLGGVPLPIHFGFMSKARNDPAMEVADFVIQAAGGQSFRRHRGEQGFRKDFQAVFHANPLWSSFIDVTAVRSAN
jgi:hypothetical protein